MGHVPCLLHLQIPLARRRITPKRGANFARAESLMVNDRLCCIGFIASATSDRSLVCCHVSLSDQVLRSKRRLPGHDAMAVSSSPNCFLSMSDRDASGTLLSALFANDKAYPSPRHRPGLINILAREEVSTSQPWLIVSCLQYY